MAINIKQYVGAFKDAYDGTLSGIWAQKAAKIETGLKSLTVLMPGLEAPPPLKAFSSTRQKETPDDFEVTMTNTPYETSEEVDIDPYRVDTMGIYDDHFREMGVKAAFHFNSLAASLLSAGHNTACHDGEYFFATDHPYTDAAGNPATQKNLFTFADIDSLHVTDKSKPTDVEMSDILVDSISQFYGLKDVWGDAINGSAREFVVVTGDIPKLAAMQKALSKDRLSDGNDNPVAGLKHQGITVTPVFEPALTGDSLYFCRADGRKALMLGEVYSEPAILDENSEYAKVNRKALFAWDVVRGKTYGRWQSAIKVTLYESP